MMKPVTNVLVVVLFHRMGVLGGVSLEDKPL